MRNHTISSFSSFNEVQQRKNPSPNGDSDLPHFAFRQKRKCWNKINQTCDTEATTDGQIVELFLKEICWSGVDSAPASRLPSGTSSFVDVHEPLISQGLRTLAVPKGQQAYRSMNGGPKDLKMAMFNLETISNHPLSSTYHRTTLIY